MPTCASLAVRESAVEKSARQGILVSERGSGRQAEQAGQLGLEVQ